MAVWVTREVGMERMEGVVLVVALEEAGEVVTVEGMGDLEEVLGEIMVVLGVATVALEVVTVSSRKDRKYTVG